MATQIYRVDLSENARDFQATATEPGLPMLDRQGSNFEILQQWFGTLIAEPDIDGFLVGGASLDPEKFLAIIRSCGS